MSMFSKITGLALKALDKSGSSNQTQNAGQNAGQKDWRAIIRTAADTLTGDGRTAETTVKPHPTATNTHPVRTHRDDSSATHEEISNADRAAIARYDYLLETADPHQIEQMHREAFERLTPAQRDQVQQRMHTELPAKDHPRTAGADDLARTAARAEVGRPGFLRGLLARAGNNDSARGGISRGVMVGGAAAGAGLLAGGVLTAVAGGAVVSSLAGPLLEQASSLGVDFEALGNGIDLEGLSGGLGESVANAGETVSGLGEQFGDVGSNFNLPGLDDLFGR
ncbi:hypothetical protein [Paeniglutamicibacter antarcticus]|uniref:Cation-transporting ATPase n=1 Tax=Paeniglutamicibacter antarcticus TaxID=494023 RepID=A0ABP9TPP1_9MICC